MFKKIHFGYALLIICSISTIPASIYITSLLLSSSNAEAIIGSNIGLQVLSVPIKCIQDELSPTCNATCTFCGDLAGICNGMTEVKTRFLNGINVLHNSALCLVNPVILQGAFRPGVKCIGKVVGVGPHILYNFGCGK